ncbi:MAG: hypothetical protein AAFR31_19985 [Cyanobacteria bacterium J06627_8]
MACDLSDPLIRIQLNLKAIGDRRYTSSGADRFSDFCLKHGIDEPTDYRRLARLTDEAIASLDRQLEKLAKEGANDSAQQC